MTRSIPARAALDRRDPVAPSQASTTHRAFPVVGDRGGEVDVRDPREHGPHDEPELARGGRLRHSPQLVGARRRLDRRGRVHRPDCPSHEAPIALRAVRRPRAHGLVDPLRRPLAGRDLVIRLRLASSAGTLAGALCSPSATSSARSPGRASRRLPAALAASILATSSGATATVIDPAESIPAPPSGAESTRTSPARSWTPSSSTS